jgi:hypothetical protein
LEEKSWDFIKLIGRAFEFEEYCRFEDIFKIRHEKSADIAVKIQRIELFSEKKNKLIIKVNKLAWNIKFSAKETLAYWYFIKFRW